ncbi:LPXTG cell wall anchor domain-containing protein, partial [Streptococcus agalactiae]|nr:LPXTG cell wall anchor domain-containing protein [Streptococcus agalactiae]
MAIKLNNNFLIIMGTSFLLLLAYHIKKRRKRDT